MSIHTNVHLNQISPQAAAYVGALNADPRHEFRVRSACVVVVRGDGDGVAANAIRMDTDKLGEFWKKWMLRLDTYRKIQEYRQDG